MSDRASVETQVIDAFKTCHERVDVVEFLSELALPDCWAAAGIVRNTVWDVLHGRSTWTVLHDVDIAYFDVDDISASRDREIEKRLAKKFPRLLFSAKNQARMHLRNKHSPYVDSLDAIRHWTETCTAVGISFHDGDWEILAPCGLDDLLKLIVRPTLYNSHYVDLVLSRTRQKRWLETWPMLRLWNMS